MAVKKTNKARKRRYPCPTCRGAGKTASRIIDATLPVDCPECRGTGKVTTKPKDDIDVLYDSMRVKDLTRREFRWEYVRLTDPKRAARDLSRMRTSLEIEKQTRGRLCTRA